METTQQPRRLPHAVSRQSTRCAHDRAELVRSPAFAGGEHFCPDCRRVVEYYDFDAEERGECVADGGDEGVAWE